MGNNPFTLADRTILITGASSGIGKECAIQCAAQGARVIMMARRTDALEEVRSQLHGNDHIIISIDLMIFDEIRCAFDRLASEIKVIHGFIHSAGMETTQGINLLNHDSAMRVMSLNWLAALEITKRITKKSFLPNDYMSIAYISSISSQVGKAALSVYAASKGALVSSAKSLAVELAKKKVRVNTVSPGLIVTDLTREYLASLDSEQYSERTKDYLLGLGEPIDIANACVFLLSPASKWITGTNLVVDGGLCAQ